MKTQLVIGLAFSAIGIFAAACSSSSSAPADPYPDVEHFCAAVAQSECQVLPNCETASSSLTSECATYRQSECMSGSIIVPFPGSGSALHRTYTSANVKACLTALGAAFTPASSGVNLVSYDQLFGKGNLIDTCEAVFAGTAANGATCTTNYDCTTAGDICAPVLGQTSGQCATPTAKMLGDACADPGDQCASGTYCAGSASTLPKCAAAKTVGQSCATSDECGGAAQCVGGACAALSELNGACASNTDCAADLFCDLYGGGKCEKTLDLGSASPDCSGFLLGMGASDGGTSPTGDAGGPTVDSSTPRDSGPSVTDAPTGG